MSFLRHISACNNYRAEDFLPLIVDGARAGRVYPAFAQALLDFPGVFEPGPLGGVALSGKLSGFDERSGAVADVVDALARQGVVQPRFGELYPVTLGDRDEALFVIDRAVVAHFGFPTFGQHMNGFVRRFDGIHMWIGRRARDRHLFPGRLDQLVAGGLPHGIAPMENLVKECWEEAGIERSQALEASFVGNLRYCAQTGKGAKPDTLLCYDLELPEDFEPRCTDGEVEAFYLLPLDEVADIVHVGDEFKPNCSLVVIDFLIRHGAIGSGHPEYADLMRGLRNPLC